MAASSVKRISSTPSVVSKSTVTSSKTARSSAARRSTSEKEIRSRLLRKLGIYDPTNADFSLLSKSSDPASTRRTNMFRGMGIGGVPVGPVRWPTAPSGSQESGRPRLGGAVPFAEPLKYSASPPRSGILLGSTVSPLSGGYADITDKNKRRAKIAFNDNVSVIAIPMRTEYSCRIKSRIWSSRHEIHENAARNTVEFAAEGWDWRTATEDDGMFVCTVSGELVHPVHCQHFYRQPTAISN